MKYSYVIVGAGLTGAVLARVLKDAGQSVIVLERRTEPGGNIADFFHPCGIHVHRYGPHLFRTSSERIWKFVNRFARFHRYRHQVKTRIDGVLENWPVAASYITRTCGPEWRSLLVENPRPKNFEEAARAMMPGPIFDKFVKGYTEKQWGVSVGELEASLCKRFDVRHDDNPYLTPRAKYQGIPTEGYSRMIERMLKGVPVVVNFDYLADRDLFKARKLTIFTGPIDEYFNYELGKLAYRAQKREHEYLADIEWALPCGQVNNPGEGEYIREVEWKHMMRPDYAARIKGTVVTREYPFTPSDPEAYEYPFPDERNRQLYGAYLSLAQQCREVVFCGRLGEYRYLDMDQAIARAMVLARKLVQ